MKSVPEHRGSSPRIVLVAVATFLLAVAQCATALAGTAADGNAIIHECALKDSVSGTHTAAAYQYALSHVPSDVTEYSDCGDVIRRAELAAAHGDTAGTQGGAFRDPYATASTAEKRAIVRSQHKRPGPIVVGPGEVRPGLTAVAPAAVVNRLPGPLLAALAFVLVPGALLACSRFVRRRGA